MSHFMIVIMPYINLLNLSWIKKCLFLRNMEPLIDKMPLSHPLYKWVLLWEKGLLDKSDNEGSDQTAHAQSDLGLRCPLTEPLETVEYIGC